MDEKVTEPTAPRKLGVIIRFTAEAGVELEAIGDTKAAEIADLISMASHRMISSRLNQLEAGLTQISTALRETVQVVKAFSTPVTSKTANADEPASLPDGDDSK